MAIFHKGLGEKNVFCQFPIDLTLDIKKSPPFRPFQFAWVSQSSQPHVLPSFIMFRVSDVRPDRCRRGEAEVHILDFKTTRSEFHKASLTDAERGEAELRILDFKTTWSEFQRASQTVAERGEAMLCILNFKTTWS